MCTVRTSTLYVQEYSRLIRILRQKTFEVRTLPPLSLYYIQKDGGGVVLSNGEQFGVLSKNIGPPLQGNYSTHKLHNERYVHKMYDVTAVEFKPCDIAFLFIKINKYIMIW